MDISSAGPRAHKPKAWRLHEPVRPEWAAGLPETVAGLLHRRGVRSMAEADWFLEGRDQRNHDPFLLEDMDRAVLRLRRALREGELVGSGAGRARFLTMIPTILPRGVLNQRQCGRRGEPSPLLATRMAPRQRAGMGGLPEGSSAPRATRAAQRSRHGRGPRACGLFDRLQSLPKTGATVSLRNRSIR